MIDLFGRVGKNNPEDIYFFRSDLPWLDTRKIFSITIENGKLKVKNKYVNCLFSNLTPEIFDNVYNDFNRHLNLDFAALTINGSDYSLSDDEKEELFEIIVTSWIYYYTINNSPVKIKRSDFTHPYTVGYVAGIIDRKLGVDSQEGLALGAKILRQSLLEYTKTVARLRVYYSMW